ncbi:PucR family transcriptional regulator [Microtetraspora niveoalba]|uniref:PucR family transcriptional regulator n=1 Tax=Microtetraspora niveoalba TaxID=46175 RepID=UPI000B08D5D3|nr:PucR family transcriptional regulator [Microtetraspora niveoalba]
MSELGLSLVTGRDELERRIRWVVTTDLLDPGRYLTGGELVLTGLIWRQCPEDSDRFVRGLAHARVSALAAGDPRRAELPADLVEACRKYGMPLFHVPDVLSFADVTEQIARRLSKDRAADMTAVLDRHRRLVSGVTPGSGLNPVLHMLGHDLGMPCWVLTPAGRVVAGSHRLPEETAPLLARGFLTARRMPCTVRGAERYSVFPVDEQKTARVADWFLAFEGVCEDWPEERLALAGELAAVVALERARLDDRMRPEGRIAQELIRFVLADGRPSDILPRLDVTGLVSEHGFVAVAAASHNGLRPGELRVVVKEILNRSCASPAVGVAGEEVIALLPASRSDVTAEVREAVGTLAPGLGASRLTIGVSGTVPMEGLRGAVEEARYARRIAEGRAGPGAVVGHDELATHVLLLASVPDDVRDVFRVRLLDPLRGYDRVHRADLVRTLEVFLLNSGAWRKCAEILHIHVNTLRYRIRRIQDLTGRDLSRLEDRVDFFLALRLG